MFRKFPKGWSKTIEDVLAEAKPGEEISNRELEWARNYEFSLLDKNIRFPSEGEVFAAMSDVRAYCCIYWRNPSSSGVDCTIPKGTKVKIRFIAKNKPLQIDAIPLDYEYIEKLIVPKEERSANKYDGYSLSIGIQTLNDEFTFCKSI